MSTDFESTFGRHLWRYLPELYRNRDDGDLRNYLDSFGLLLDQIRHTLDQQLLDIFPETCQEWLLPYIAQLLDVKLVSPETQGRRYEVANAVSWRKRKGTLTVVEEIAEKVGDSSYERMEIEVQEGWRRTAVTARIGVPLLSPNALGLNTPAPKRSDPMQAATHPGLPAVTVDLRQASRAEQVTQENAVSHWTRFGEETVLWQQRNPRGTPCFPDSYQDTSMRTVDLRDSDWRQGHYHPKHLLLYTTPSAGFFPETVAEQDWDELFDWSTLQEGITHNEGQLLITMTTTELADGKQQRLYQISNAIAFTTLKLKGLVSIDIAPAEDEELLFQFQGIHFVHTLEIKHGRLQLQECAVFKAKVIASDKEKPALYARDCLIRKFEVARGLSQLEYVTVLQTSVTEVIHASDCIFLGELHKDMAPVPESDPEAYLPSRGCIRYSRLPQQELDPVSQFACTLSEVVFYSKDFGTRGCGVLHPANVASVCFGSEDGSEIGAYHHRHHCLRREAVLDKLNNFLPVGIRPVFIPDKHMICAPPK